MYDLSKGHGVICMPIDALRVLCAQLRRDLLAIAKFLLSNVTGFLDCCFVNYHKFQLLNLPSSARQYAERMVRNIVRS